MSTPEYTVIETLPNGNRICERVDTVAGPYRFTLAPESEMFTEADQTLPRKQKSYHADAEVSRKLAAERFQNIRAGLRSGAGTGIITAVSTSTTTRQPFRATDKQVKYLQDLLAKIGKDHPGVQTTRQNLNAGHKARGYISFDEAKAALNILIPLAQSVQEAPTAPRSGSTTPQAPKTAPKVPNGSYAIVVDGTVKFYTVNSSTEGKWAGYTFVEAHRSDDRIPVRNREHRTAILTAIAADPKAAAVRFGRETNHCALCNRELTDEGSRAAGIGPTCAARANW